MTHKKCVKGQVNGQKSLTIFRCDMGKLRLNFCVIDNKTCTNRRQMQLFISYLVLNALNYYLMK